MTRFHFPLQRVLDWRRTQLEIEEAKFRQATAALAALDHATTPLDDTLKMLSGLASRLDAGAVVKR
jgi:hypothetical protein